MKLRFARLIAGSVLSVAVSAAWAVDEPPDEAADDAIEFEIRRFEIAGNTLLEPAVLDAAVAPFTGKGRDFGDVQRALESIEALYQARGYRIVKVQVPEQELNGGVVRLNVVETQLGRILVSGNRFVDEANVRRSLPGLRTGQSPNLDQVSASLRMANQNPARQIKLQLQSAEAGDQVDDQVDALLQVSDRKPWTAMLNLDNAGTGETGDTNVGVMLQHANLWGRDHVGSVQYSTTAEEPGKVKVYGAGYHIPLYQLGDSIDLFASYSNIDSGSISAGLVDLTVSGKGAVYGARYNMSLGRRGALESQLVYGVDIKAFKNTVLFAGQNFGNDITVRPVSIGYLASSALAGGQANVSLTLVHNIPGGSRGKAADFARVRSSAKAGYSMVRFAGAFSRALGGDWQARLLLNGQFSGDALVPGEQFGAGGASSVRGFKERAVSTDSGVLANAEIITPNLCSAQIGWQCRALGFYDGAVGKRNAALPGELSSTTIGSAGVGVRIAMGRALNMQIDYGHVLRAGATDAADNNQLHVRVGLAY